MIQSVHIFDEWATMGHRVIVRGRPHPGAPAHFLTAEGEWERIEENTVAGETAHIGFRLPEGALDAIVHERLKIAAPQQSTERHLDDARSMRDRLLALIEKRGLR